MESLEAEIASMSTSPERSLGVSLSGGGNRASAFGLGALLYLADVARLPEVAAISSVSGGSVTNAFWAARICLEGNDLRGRAVWERSVPLAKLCARKTLLGAAALIVVPFVGVGILGAWVATHPGDVNWWALVDVVLLAAVAFTAFYYFTIRVNLRSDIETFLGPIERAGVKNRFQKFRAANQGVNKLRLGNFASTYCPIFCSTDLASGTHFYMSTKFTAGVTPHLETREDGPYVDVAGAAPNLPVATAVIASAAFPGAIQPVRLRAAELGLPYQTGVVPSVLRLADGGVYDNLGFTFFRAWHEPGHLPDAVTADLPPAPTRYIAIDSGRASYVAKSRLGFIGSFQRSINVSYQANTDARRREINTFFAQPGIEGVLVRIGDSPYDVLVRSHADSKRKSLVESALEQLQDRQPVLTHSWWASVAQELNPSVKTTFARLGDTVTARLILHGYMLTLAHATLMWGWEPPAVLPDLDTVAAFVEGTVPTLFEEHVDDNTNRLTPPITKTPTPAG